MAQQASVNPMSCLGNNARNILSSIDRCSNEWNEYVRGVNDSGSVLKELIDVRESYISMNGFTRDEINVMIEHICIN